MDISPLVPRDAWEAFAWFGRVKEEWVTVEQDDPLLSVEHGRLPVTTITPRADVLERAGLRDNPEALRAARGLLGAAGGPALTFRGGHGFGPAYLEAASRLIADGPKVFVPTDEQFESMEHVELDIPVGDFRSPFPALAVAVPPATRQRLRAEHGVTRGDLTGQVLVRVHRRPGRPLFCFVFVPTLGTADDLFLLFQDVAGNDSVEQVLRRVVDGNGVPAGMPAETAALHNMAKPVYRAVLNLCLMLVHYGHRLGGPVDPAAYAKHRKKKNLTHLRHGDCLAVHLQQEVVVRAPASPSDAEPGDPTGREVRPHWRRGFWRRRPGYRAYLERNEQPPLVFVRPCLVRRDRLVGDPSETSATYHVREDA